MSCHCIADLGWVSSDCPIHGEQHDFDRVLEGVKTGVKTGEMEMSPLEIHCLLELYSLGKPNKDGANQHPVALDVLSKGGLIQEVDGPVLSMGHRPEWELTDKGYAHVENLCNLSYPVAKTIWVIPG